jgi:hypothetical protein
MVELARPESEETAIELTPILRWEDDGGQTILLTFIKIG